MDLSSPHGHSTNNGIEKNCSLHYTSVDEAALQVARLSCRALLAKMDIQQAYRNIPMYVSQGQTLAGLTRGWKVYINQVLPLVSD